MWSRNPPQTHHISSTMLEEKPNMEVRDPFSNGILKSMNNRFWLFEFQSWPEWRENYFLSEGLETKEWSSNSGRDKKENWHGDNWQKCERPRHWGENIDKIPYNRSLLWIPRPPVIRKIIRSWGTNSYCSSSMITTVVWRSSNINLISLNLINYLSKWPVSI